MKVSKTSMITLTVSRDSTPESVIKRLHREIATAMNIKNKGNRKSVIKSINRLLQRQDELKDIGNGYIAFSSPNDT